MVPTKTIRFDTMTRIPAILLVLLASTVLSRVSYADDNAVRVAIEAARELYAAGNWETAGEAYEDALRAATPGTRPEAEAMIELASLRWEQGDYAGAHERASKALSAAKKLKLDDAVGRLMLTLGHIEASQGRLAAAQSTLQICVRSAAEQRDANFEALCRINLRFVRQLRGQAVGSEKAYRRDLDTLKRSGQSVLVGTALAKSAELQERAQDFHGALGTLRQAEAQFAAAGSVPAESRNKLRLAQALQNLNRWDEAAKELDGLVLTFRNMKNRPALVTAYALRGKQRAHDADRTGALQDYELAARTARTLGSPQLIANTDLALCEFFAVAGDSERSRKHCMSASKGFSSVGIPSLAARSRILLARLAQSQKEWLTAREHYLEALRVLSEDVAPSARDEREIAVQEVNLCQVELQLKSNGAYRRCLDAREALAGVTASDASYRGMVAATDYAVGVTTPAREREKAMRSLDAAAEAWIQLGNGPQAAEALLRLGKHQADSKKTRVTANSTFDRGLKALGPPSDAPRQVVAIQLAIQKAQVELALESWLAARKTLETIVGWATASDDTYSAAWAYSGLAQARLKLKDRVGAIDALRLGESFASRAGDDDLLQLIRSNLDKLEGK